MSSPNRPDPRRFDLSLLRTLVAVVEERSTVKAARRLFVSQPTVSGNLSRLREAFGDELLVRNGRDLEPTVRALELLDTIKPHLEGLAEAVAAEMPFNLARDSRTFRLGCTDAVALAVLPALGAALRQEAPACDLVLRVGDYRALPAMLASGEVSSVLGFLKDDPPATAKAKVLARSPWVTLRDAATPPVRDLDDFCARPHALVTPLGDLSGFVDDELEQAGLKRRVVLGVTNFALLAASLPGTDLLATVPDFVAPRLAELAGLSVDDCPVAIPPVANSLAWRATVDRDPAERWFRSALEAAFRATIAEDKET